jgi:hypothetical protein
VDNSLNYQNVWQKSKYIAIKQRLFEKVDAYVGRPTKCILDIGCGFAKTSELFQKKYGCDLYLLESDIGKSSGTRIGKWGSADNFQWYLPISRLEQAWQEQGMSYNLVDGSDPKIPSDVKFDLVYSWLSCGFHYPVSTYKTLIQKHTHKDSIIIVDFRNNLTASQIAQSDQKQYRIIKVLEETNKKRTCHIEFV